MIMKQVDSHIQQLDQYLKKYDEDLRRGMFLLPSPFSTFVSCIVGINVYVAT